MDTKRSLKPGYLPSFRKQVPYAQALELGKDSFLKVLNR